MNMRCLKTLALMGAVCAVVVPVGAQASHAHRSGTTVYVATLHPLNTSVTGMRPTGVARFTVQGDSLTISISARHVPPDIVHWQHVHGFTDDRRATCPTEAADTTHDGIIDLIETGATSGTTMVPFTDDPVSMQIPSDTYPKASADSAYQYRTTVSLSALQAAFAKAFDGQQLDLDRRVVFIHGVPPTATLPASVASLGTVPAHVTLPIACGTITRRGR